MPPRALWVNESGDDEDASSFASTMTEATTKAAGKHPGRCCRGTRANSTGAGRRKNHSAELDHASGARSRLVGFQHRVQQLQDILKVDASSELGDAKDLAEKRNLHSAYDEDQCGC